MKHIALRVGLSTLFVAVTETPEEMHRGLAGQPGLPDGWGMLFDMGVDSYHPFHMIGVTFPLDFIFVDAAQRVAAILQEQPPGRPEVGATGRWIIEAPSGWARRHGVSIGTIVIGLPAPARDY